MSNFPRISSFFADFTIGLIGTSRKISCKNLYSVKLYGETNVKVFVLGLWGKLSWGLTYFDEFILKIGFIRETCIYFLLSFCSKQWIMGTCTR